MILFLDKRELQSDTAGNPVNPCSKPLTYKIGEIDERFNLAPAELRRFMNGAGKLWSDAAGSGRQLLEYDDEGEITVHLIYDERQQMIEGEMNLTSRIQNERSMFDRLHRDYLRISSWHKEALEDYETVLGSYQKKLAIHNEKVDVWNSEGSASGLDKEELLEGENELQRLNDQLGDLRDKVNASGEQSADLKLRLDDISGRKDGLIQEYNNQFAGEHRFNQGEYVSRDGEKRIHVYHYQSMNHLRLVLAHEVGHALGLGHAENPESVMYPVVESSGRAEIRLSPEDVAAILNRCN